VVISGDWLGSSGRRTGVLVGGDIGETGQWSGRRTGYIQRWALALAEWSAAMWATSRKTVGGDVEDQEYWSEFWSVVMSGTGRSTTGWW
jgi:hypothetical protein